MICGHALNLGKKVHFQKLLWAAVHSSALKSQSLRKQEKAIWLFPTGHLGFLHFFLPVPFKLLFAEKFMRQLSFALVPISQSTPQVILANPLLYPFMVQIRQPVPLPFYCWFKNYWVIIVKTRWRVETTVSATCKRWGTLSEALSFPDAELVTQALSLWVSN